MEKVRCMLQDAGLYERFWAEAAQTAVYIKNRTPTKAVMGITPEEKWTGKKPLHNGVTSSHFMNLIKVIKTSYLPLYCHHHLHPNVKQQMRVKLAAQGASYFVRAGILAKTTSTTAQWSNVKSFYELDKSNQNLVFAPVLTDHHLHPNVKQQMRVKLAAQGASYFVRAGILAKTTSNDLPIEACATATSTQKFDELFDAVNAESPDLCRGKNIPQTGLHEASDCTIVSAILQTVSSWRNNTPSISKLQ